MPRERLNYAFHHCLFRFYEKHYARRRRAPVNLAVHVTIGAKLARSLLRLSVQRRLEHHGGQSS